jgi:lactoylglutathione lyase
MEESLKFYEEIVGLQVDRRYHAGPEREIVFLGDGDTKIELISNGEVKDVSVGQDISLGFEVKSVEEKVEFVKQNGVEPITGLLQPNPHVRFFYVLDPNGLKIQFVENC